MNRQVLENLGVPPQSIEIIPQPVDNTLAELRAVLHYAGRQAPGPIIIVSSKTHTRRVRVIWDKIGTPAQLAIVRYTPKDTYNPVRWWASTRDAQTSFRDMFGILNAWAGFPISPRE